MQQSLAQTTALLSRTPATLDVLLRDLPEEWFRSPEGEKGWSASEVVSHLITCEREVWIPRAKILLAFGGSRTFERFDREASNRHAKGGAIAELLDGFSRVRAECLDELRSWNLQPEDFERRGVHPGLGSVTLGELLAAWAVHDLTHLHQISRVLAHQYRGAVGSWGRYLGVLRCNGHGASA